MWKSLGIGVFLGALFLVAVPRDARAVTVSIAPGDTTVAAGDTVEVRFVVDAFPDLKGFELVFPYDATRLEFISAMPGEVLTSPGGAYAAFVIPDVAAPADTFQFDAVMLDGATQGPGILVYAKFRAIGSGDAAITCGSAEFRNSLNQSTVAGCAGATLHLRIPDVRISQIYGGGGSDPASPYANDYVELFNADSVTADLTGWTVQYRFPGDEGWQATALSGTIPPGGYYLVQEAQGPNGSALPVPDATGAIDLSPASGSVAVVASALALAVPCPADPLIVDRIGYGAADCFDTAPWSALDDTTAAFRRFDGCQDTDDNLSDFLSASPAPRNSAAPLETCRFMLSVSSAPPGGGTIGVAPDLATYAFGLSVELTVTTAPGYVFSGWSGDASGTDNPLTVLMDGDKAVVAEFVPDVSAHPIVISQVYGAGGDVGADYRNDFIELFNRGFDPVDLTGWSVQYAPDSGAAWTATPLSGTIQPGRYYLVQQAAGVGGTLDLPAPDAVGTTTMDATRGKVALVNHAAVLSDTCPTGAGIEDFVGYGTADCAETAPTTTPATIVSGHRLEAGCVDTDDNQMDFEALAPAPRNSASPLHLCDYWVDVDPVVDLSEFSLAVTPNPSRGAAVLRFTLPRSGETRLRVHDLQGRIIATLHDGVLAAGTHRAVWNGSIPTGLARSGVYFVRLEAPGRTLQRTLVVIR